MARRLSGAAGDVSGDGLAPESVGGARLGRQPGTLPPVTTARIAGGALTAATPIPGTAAPGRRPVRETVGAIRPPAVTVPYELPTAARNTGATPATTAAGARGNAVAMVATRPLVPARPPVRASRVGTRAFQNPDVPAESGIYPDTSGYIRWYLFAIQSESKTEDTSGKLTACSDSLWQYR